jgi:hypothetical protein
MIDQENNKPIRVFGVGSPYIAVPVSQLPEVRKLLETHGIVHWLDRNALSFNHGPLMAYVNFEHYADTEAIQRLLDAA